MIDPKCRYCGQKRSVALKAVKAHLPNAGAAPNLCPADGHTYPPAKCMIPVGRNGFRSCDACNKGACIECEAPGSKLPCPHCGRKR